MTRRYLDKTFESIMKNMLDKIPDNIDKREGSIIYDALAPAATEFTQMYIELDNVLELAFTQTSNGEWLDLRCSEQGIYRKDAIKAQRKGIFNIEIPLGSRFSIDNVVYTTLEPQNLGGIDKEYILECETSGQIGNDPIGDLLPISYLDGLETATINDILVPGIEKEDDMSLYLRYKEKIEKPPTSGNLYHYNLWAKEVAGVGAAKVIPIWNGLNTVKIIIIDTEMQPATSVLVDEVQNYIDPNSQGLGEGIAPIGAICTVESAQSETIDISATVNGADGSNILSIFEDKVLQYFKDIVLQNWQSGNSYSVSYAMIGSLLLESISEHGGIDYSNLTINSVTTNIQLTDKIPVIGTVTLT